MDEEIEELIREVSCPECQCDVQMDFPRGTEIVSIATSQADLSDVNLDDNPRRSELQKECLQDHTVIVLYDW